MQKLRQGVSYTLPSRKSTNDPIVQIMTAWLRFWFASAALGIAEGPAADGWLGVDINATNVCSEKVQIPTAY